MFTGIIEELGVIRAIQHQHNLVVLQIGASQVLEQTKLGDSIAVNGICLTVTNLGSDYFEADVMPETLRRTSLGKYRVGDEVNLERALRMGDRLGGHLVSGHVDGGATLVRIDPLDQVSELTFALDAPHKGLIIPKGSIAIDGISLTIMALSADQFSVGIIPHTLAHTNLGEMAVGARVNIEYDIYGKYVQAQFVAKSDQSNLSESDLNRWGY